MYLRNKLLACNQRLYGNILTRNVRVTKVKISMLFATQIAVSNYNDDVVKWKYFLRYCPFVRGIHRSPVNSPHIGQCRGTLIFSLICACINGWIYEAGDLRRHRAHYDVRVMWYKFPDFSYKPVEIICNKTVNMYHIYPGSSFDTDLQCFVSGFVWRLRRVCLCWLTS